MRLSFKGFFGRQIKNDLSAKNIVEAFSPGSRIYLEIKKASTFGDGLESNFFNLIGNYSGHDRPL
jgi:hypothetical protein